MSTRYQELEQQIKTLQEEHQKQVQKLQAQVERLKKEEQVSKLPAEFKRESVINFLKNPNRDDLEFGFSWSSTPQGPNYWCYIYNCLCNSRYKVPDEAIIQLQKWVIQSYQQQYGN